MPNRPPPGTVGIGDTNPRPRPEDGVDFLNDVGAAQRAARAAKGGVDKRTDALLSGKRQDGSGFTQVCTVIFCPDGSWRVEEAFTPVPGVTYTIEIPPVD